jgi:urease accessory protein
MKRLLIAAGAILAASPALAHHPLGGLPMLTFADGALSGVGHPVLGFDHLFFVAAMGIAAHYTTQRYLTPVAYIVAMLAGVLIASAGVVLPMVETVIVVSLIALGSIILSGRALALIPALVVFAGFGLFHGAAFGDTIAAQESGVGGAVLMGYLIGLGITQYLMALGAGLVAEKAFGATTASAVNARLAGAMVAGVGIFLALEVLEGPIVALIAAA